MIKEYRLFKTDCETNDKRAIIDPVIDMKTLPLLMGTEEGHDGARIVDKVVQVAKLSHSNWWTGWTEYEVPEGYFLSPAFVGGYFREADGIAYMVGSRLRNLVILPLDKACWDGYDAPIPKKVRIVS